MAAATKRIVDLAKEAQTAVILDIDLEPILWQPNTEERLRTIFKYCDIIIGNNDELCIAGASHHLYGALEQLHKTPSNPSSKARCAGLHCLWERAE